MSDAAMRMRRFDVSSWQSIGVRLASGKFEDDPLDPADEPPKY
jgi:hypothetical protein